MNVASNGQRNAAIAELQRRNELKPLLGLSKPVLQYAAEIVGGRQKGQANQNGAGLRFRRTFVKVDNNPPASDIDLEWLLLKKMGGQREIRSVPDGVMLSQDGHELFVADDLRAEPIDQERFFAQHHEWTRSAAAAFILVHEERKGVLRRRSKGYYDNKVVNTVLNTMGEYDRTLLVKASQVRTYLWFDSYLGWLPDAQVRDILDAGRLSFTGQMFGRAA
ncbi:hypothetical protein [Arvimicrobium flavum]|uniref:hypothetical protein n=1 Tax=Arvimicrobium flavum TaxID=3393320 RepID=UPI00237BB512|nr:hypothetical protein [Mesorhizobium shangrilense]